MVPLTPGRPGICGSATGRRSASYLTSCTLRASLRPSAVMRTT